MTTISEAEFVRICHGIRADRETIIRHNPIGTHQETLLWMLLSVLVSYLNLDESQTPCFTGRPDEQAFRNAILFVLRDRKAPDFDAGQYLDMLLNE
jgi:hypothetical protein